MINNSGIYKITNLLEPNKVYIGQTVNFKKRYRDHFPPRKDEDSYIHRAINALGVENFSWEILEYIDEHDTDLLNEREKYWIKYYHSYYKDNDFLGGYNLTEGGQIFSDCLKKPILQYDNNGIFIKRYDSISSASRELDIDKSVILRSLNNPNRIRGIYIWRYEDDSTSILPIKYIHIGIPIYQFDVTGKLLNIFDNLDDAELQTDISKTSICLYCKDKKIHNNAIWRYENEIEFPLQIIKGTNNCGIHKKIGQYSKDNILIQTYPSISEAHRETNINLGNISEVCRGKRKTAGGFVWKFIDN